ncbi:glycosyltransferase family 2 protein [Ramlibacter tataouinensis]|uniref:glycosyltransferase family 2 protein n=1 Tax=Ramlibacter tataouinensis TaxID=94132 RepID=UPI0022F3E033|nr:glycosyltransferase family 2 protein [Ramlibacter tataouinensis]WBY02963.1 glycosyltransferase family 2 protein [Ramlibacter tataouinensis]
MNTLLDAPELEQRLHPQAPLAERQPARAGHRLSVVVPVYNEVENAQPLVEAVQAALAAAPWPWELIVVDDGSTDGTGQALDRSARATGRHVRVLHLSRNFRQTAALQAGIDAARGDLIATLDGDLQNDPADIPRLVHRLLDEDLDMVAGWRRERHDGLLLRRLPSRLANRLIRRVTGLQFQDLGCSLKVFRAPVLRQVRLYGEMHRFIPAWLSTVTSPSRMAEEPVQHHPRRAGQSKYGLGRTVRVLLDLLAMHFFLRFGTRPGHFFGGIGLLVLLAGAALLGYMAVLKAMGESIGTRPLLLLGFFLVLGGVQLLTTGVLSELLMRVYYGGGPARPYQLRAPSPDPAESEAGWHG